MIWSEGEARLLDAVDISVIATDLEGVTTVWNQGAERLYGWCADEALGRPLTELLGCERTPEQDAALAERGAWEDKMVLNHRDGTTVSVDVRLSPIADESGGVVGLVGVTTEASVRAAAERRVRAARASLSDKADDRHWPEDQQWEKRIEAALAGEGFVLHAQPLIDLESGAIVQHELLIRMRNDDGSLTAPANFLPVAERRGLMLEIDRWVIHRAARLAGEGHPVEFNVSGSSIGDADLARIIERELSAAAADPSLVVVEVTETALVFSDDAGAGFVDQLTALGCKIALDDFGMGYSGFNYLKQLPVHFLKIDREFVVDLVRDQRSRYVVEAIVHLAKAFSQETIAEGVEDQETLRLLVEMGVDYAQGLTIGPPQPLALALTGR